MTTVVINEAGIQELVNNPRGQIALELLDAAEQIVVPTAQDFLDVPYAGPFAKGDSPDPNHVNPPFRRTGTLQDSVRALSPVVDEFGLVVLVVADAVSESGWPYGVELRNEGYRYIPESSDYQYS